MRARSFLDWLRGRRPPAPVLRLYTRADCPLCDAMKAELARARVRPTPRLEEVDIAREPALAARYGRSIPVLEIDGRVAFKGRLSAAEFERKYARRQAELREGGALRAPDGERESRHG